MSSTLSCPLAGEHNRQKLSLQHKSCDGKLSTFSKQFPCLSFSYSLIITGDQGHLYQQGYELTILNYLNNFLSNYPGPSISSHRCLIITSTNTWNTNEHTQTNYYHDHPLPSSTYTKSKILLHAQHELLWIEYETISDFRPTRLNTHFMTDRLSPRTHFNSVTILSDFRMARIWKELVGGLSGLAAIAEWPAVMEHEWASLPICVPWSWQTDLLLPHWICAVVVSLETKLVPLSLSRWKSAGSVVTRHLSWMAAASSK